ncbi:hypothetical protein K458DRAFT_289408 [Lentithecium fluviatile CBS 122367]|uniref:BZIP domain-containing protein n=1 Tax=Lentithecium fluviatile CBS 122367 TaxID=1168545 RepID=A0A6G1JIX6_9PLEO|nr:hypothetical protein K458DRAFT_289408 [Lentithecium fluviatile CBS 122367]
MSSTSTFRSHTMSPSGRKERVTEEGKETGKKPKKANSEIRKQQNRIASRNYREKRKRKLQYLQQLVNDDDSSEQEAAQLAEQDQAQRLVTPEFVEQRPTARSMVLPSNSGYSTLSPTSGNMLNPMLATSAAPYDTQYRPSSQPLPSYEPTWPVSVYDPIPPINISSWNVPNWMPSIDYTPPMTSRSDAFQFTPPHSHHSFEELSTPPQQSRTPDSDLFMLGSYSRCSRRLDSHFSNASVPSSAASSPFCHTQYTSGA